jgi:histidine ammonia-lyase
MITLAQPSDINWSSVCAVAYDSTSVEISPALLEKVENGRRRFNELIRQGAPCYGVTTGLGRLSTTELSVAERKTMSRNILLARAVAFGDPLPRPVVRAMLLLRLVNFLSGRDGVSAQLCCFIAERLNDHFDPWVPSMGHGFAADGTSNAHCFQTLIGEGRVLGKNSEPIPASEALSTRGVEPYEPEPKEGLALITGITALPAYAIYAYKRVESLHRLATLVAAVSLEAAAAPKDAVDGAVGLDTGTGVSEVIEQLNIILQGSQVKPDKLQSSISMRIIPQVHGAHRDALRQVKSQIEQAMKSFSGNPMLVEDPITHEARFLSVGSFHNQALVNQIEHLAIATSHVICLSERRLHRLMDERQTGLNPQLAPRPGLDAGLVVAHKACIDLVARVRLAAQPISLLTSETSGGQEDYMSMALPVIQRLLEIVEHGIAIFGYEALAGCVALDQRNARYGQGVSQFHRLVREHIAPLACDRSPGQDLEVMISLIQREYFLEPQ